MKNVQGSGRRTADYNIDNIVLYDAPMSLESIAEAHAKPQTIITPSWRVIHEASTQLSPWKRPDQLITTPPERPTGSSTTTTTTITELTVVSSHNHNIGGTSDGNNTSVTHENGNSPAEDSEEEDADLLDDAFYERLHAQRQEKERQRWASLLHIRKQRQKNRSNKAAATAANTTDTTTDINNAVPEFTEYTIFLMQHHEDEVGSVVEIQEKEG
eukprot:GEZU01036343.1.p1 GENE.GEZU01036343.1~~GEZU01036343.1.p1  ORF type:complete len:229 (-),score=53.09 GEZU01036343.1:170-811(-)